MSQPQPPLSTLRAFEAAARHASFAAAAAELFVTPAAISHQIKALELALGLALFRRRSRGVELTEAGLRYRDDIARGLLLIDRATESLKRTRINGPLRVSLPQSMAQLWLIPRLHRLSQRYPGLELHISGDNRIADVRGGEVDVALRFGHGHYPGLHVSHLMSDAVSLLIASESLARMEGNGAAAVVRQSVLLEDNWVGPDEPWMTWTPWLREIGITDAPATRRLRFSDSAMAVSACQASAGVCIGRLSLVLEPLQRRQLSVLMPWRSAEYAHYLVMRETDQDNPRISVFEQWLRAEVREYAGRALAVSGFRLRSSSESPTSQSSR